VREGVAVGVVVVLLPPNPRKGCEAEGVSLGAEGGGPKEGGGRELLVLLLVEVVV